MSRESVLQQAQQLVSVDRAQVYGSAQESFDRIADLWSGFLSDKLVEPITSRDVALMMVLLKVSRAKGAPLHEDSYVDIAGYAALAQELEVVEEDDTEIIERATRSPIANESCCSPERDRAQRFVDDILKGTNRISEHLGYFDKEND